jgi:hypothetical protein
MPMLAEVLDAVVGIDTHRDSHEAEIADAAGKPLTMMRIGNDSTGFRAAAGRHHQGSARPADSSLDRGQPQLRDRGWPGRWPPLACW